MLTSDFHKDKKITLINCNPKISGGRAYRRKAVLLGETSCPWKHSYKAEVDDNVGFRTTFRMYRTENDYFLQVIGESDRPSDFPSRYKVIMFKSPQELSEILKDSSDRRVYMSEPVVELIEKVADSKYLDERESQYWIDNCLYL